MGIWWGLLFLTAHCWYAFSRRSGSELTRCNWTKSIVKDWEDYSWLFSEWVFPMIYAYGNRSLFWRGLSPLVTSSEVLVYQPILKKNPNLPGSHSFIMPLQFHYPLASSSSPSTSNLYPPPDHQLQAKSRCTSAPSLIPASTCHTRQFSTLLSNSKKLYACLPNWLVHGSISINPWSPQMGPLTPRRGVVIGTD